MGIEIRQLVVNSNVVQRREPGKQDESNSEESKNQDILDEVRRMIAQALRETKER